MGGPFWAGSLGDPLILGELHPVDYYHQLAATVFLHRILKREQREERKKL